MSNQRATSICRHHRPTRLRLVCTALQIQPFKLRELSHGLCTRGVIGFSSGLLEHSFERCRCTALHCRTLNLGYRFAITRCS
mmetsp:Transcript_13435/g.47376  ORF Transcript_13435/g.47376 Transcript_13435/m.47376 type:complete len:82 (+) Transcript_13435:179-424(+)